VIKNLETKDDALVLTLSDLVTKYHAPEATIGLKTWTKDGSYFWGRLSEGADVFAFFRVKRDIWETEVFSTPQGTMGGDALNAERGYVTYDTGPGWSGVQEIAEEVDQEWKQQGRTVNFYLYNLITRQKTLLNTTDDTIWFHKPAWVSDTTLEYELPNGDKKTYRIE